jgi:hypothetical protein
VLEERCRAYIRNQQNFRATILRTDVAINLRNAAAAYVQGDRSVVQFLELLSSQRMYEKNEHFCFGNRFYEQSSAKTMRDVAPILKKGLQKNVRFVGDSMQDAQPILQIDRQSPSPECHPHSPVSAKKSAFFPPVSVLEFLCAFFGNGLERPLDARDFEGNFWRRESNLSQANKQIRSLSLVRVLPFPSPFPRRCRRADHAPERQPDDLRHCGPHEPAGLGNKLRPAGPASGRHPALRGDLPDAHPLPAPPGHHQAHAAVGVLLPHGDHEDLVGFAPPPHGPNIPRTLQ